MSNDPNVAALLSRNHPARIGVFVLDLLIGLEHMPRHIARAIDRIGLVSGAGFSEGICHCVFPLLIVLVDVARVYTMHNRATSV
jgi:CO dehydrogenase nickel-insertion accessory protein CooC1